MLSYDNVCEIHADVVFLQCVANALIVDVYFVSKILRPFSSVKTISAQITIESNHWEEMSHSPHT